MAGNGGWLANVADLNDFGTTLLNNIAPVDPEASLSALERVLLVSESNTIAQQCGRYVPLIRSLAYDAALFERSTALLLRIAKGQSSQSAEVRTTNSDANEASRAFASLFPIYFSGTHATLDQRLAAIHSLVRSDDPTNRILGLMALKAAMETSHFGPRVNFEFGARSRDYGYWPSTKRLTVITFTEPLPSESSLKYLLAEERAKHPVRRLTFVFSNARAEEHLHWRKKKGFERSDSRYCDGSMISFSKDYKRSSRDTAHTLRSFRDFCVCDAVQPSGVLSVIAWFQQFPSSPSFT